MRDWKLIGVLSLPSIAAVAFLNFMRMYLTKSMSTSTGSDGDYYMTVFICQGIFFKFLIKMNKMN